MYLVEEMVRLGGDYKEVIDWEWQASGPSTRAGNGARVWETSRDIWDMWN